LGHYRAAVFNEQGPFGDGYSVVDCVLDEAASIAAGGGGGVVLDGTQYVFEINNGTTAPVNVGSHSVAFDSPPDPLPPAGLYIAEWQVYVDQPAEARTVTVAVDGGNSTPACGPVAIPAGADNSAALIIDGGGIAVMRDDSVIDFAITNTTSGGASSPAALSINYGWLRLTAL